MPRKNIGKARILERLVTTNKLTNRIDDGQNEYLFGPGHSIKNVKDLGLRV